MRPVGGLETGHSRHAVRMVQGRSVGCADVRTSDLGGHRRTVVLGRRTHQEHVVHDRRQHYGHHIHCRAMR